MLQVPAAATVATAQATGPRTAESPCLPPRTGAASIIQAVPQLLDPGQEVLPTEAQSDRGDDVLFSQLSEVKEVCKFEESSGTILSQVKGRLTRHVQFWRSIGAPRYVLSAICEGYRLPFLQIPPAFTSRNNKSALDHSEFVNDAILELLITARGMELYKPPHVVNPLSVSIQPNGKKRLILDLRYINNFLIKRKVKYEDWKVALSYFQKGSFMITFNLKSGYHHVEIHPDHLTFLRLAWKFPKEASIRYLCFQFFLLVCRLHHTFLRNVLSRLRSIRGSTVLTLLCFLTMVG